MNDTCSATYTGVVQLMQIL